MKQKLTFWLAAFMALFVSFNAGAVKATLTWNIPGAIEIYVGAQNAQSKVALSATADHYVAEIDNTWGSAYVTASTGYVIDSVIADGDALNSVKFYGLGKMGYNIDLSKYDCKTVVITASKIVYDGTFTVNLINGQGKVEAKMMGTDRAIDLKTGMNYIQYSTAYEPGVDITAPKPGEDDFVPVLKQDGIQMEWAANYAWDSMIYHKENGVQGFPITNGTSFEIKYSDVADVPVEIETAKVNFTFSGHGREALTMLFNTTKFSSIAIADEIEVEKGDVLRIGFNCYDYTITVNGVELSPTVGAQTVTTDITINGDTNISVSAVDREYGSTSVSFAVADINGVLLYEGNEGGKLIDPSTLTQLSTANYSYEVKPDPNVDATVRKSATLTTYSATVSLKNPRVFLVPTEGYWFEASEYNTEDGKAEGTMASPEIFVYCVNKQIKADTKVVFYLSTDGVNMTPDKLMIRDKQRNDIVLRNGYNEMMMDVDYSSPLTINALSDSESVNVAVFCNMDGMSADDNGSISCKFEGESIIHIFAGRTAPADYQVDVYYAEPVEGAEVIVDRVVKLDSKNNNCYSFKGCEVSVKPAGMKYQINGETPEFEGDVHTFALSEATSIVLGDPAKIEVTPGNGETITEFKGFVVSFPNATYVDLLEGKEGEFALSDAANVSYGCQNFTVTKISGASVPTFRINVVGPAPTKAGAYRFIIPEGVFKVMDKYTNEDFVTYFTLSPDTKIEDIPVNFNPYVDMPLSQFRNEGVAVIFGDEPGEHTLAPADMVNACTVKFNGATWTAGVDYEVEVDNAMGYVQIRSLNEELTIDAEAKLYVSFAAGAFMVDGNMASLAMENTWTIVPDKTFSIVVVSPAQVIASPAELAEIVITIPEAETAEIFNAGGATLQHTDYLYNGTAVITPVTGEAPSFKLAFETPDAIGKYRLYIQSGTFLLDGAYESPEYEMVFGDLTTSVNDGIFNDAAVTVYDLNGRVIARNANVADLKALNNGLYIINGKKYIKK